MWVFHRLDVWRRSVDFVDATYDLTATYPTDERFGLVTQTRRAANSVGADIAEGAGRSTVGEFVQFLGYARGSACEAQHHFAVARRLGFLSGTDYDVLDVHVQEIKRMLTGLRRHLRGTNG